MNDFITQALHNRILITGLFAWLCSQVLKLIIHLIVNRKLVVERLFGDGGMPSSHSATVSSVAAATGMVCGWSSPEFAIAFIVAVIVMHDARGVRQETGKQAKVINDMIELFEAMGKGSITPEQTLKEFVGHTPMQVAVGCVLGIVIGILMNL